MEDGSIPWLWDREWEESAASAKSASELEGALSGAGDGQWRKKASLNCGKRSEGVRSTYEGIHLGGNSQNALHPALGQRVVEDKRTELVSVCR